MKVEYREIPTTTVAKKTIYIACDGKEFDNAKDCQKYEDETYYNVINYRFTDMILYHSDGESMFVPYCNEDEDVVIIIPKNADDIAFLNKIMIHHNGENCKLLSREHIGQYIMIEYNDWNNSGIMNVDWFGWESIGEHIKKFTQAMQTAIKCASELEILQNERKLKKKNL